MSKVMESNRLREPGTLHGRLEVPAIEVVVAQRAALRTCEDEFGRATATRPRGRGEVGGIGRVELSADAANTIPGQFDRRMSDGLGLTLDLIGSGSPSQVAPAAAP